MIHIISTNLVKITTQQRYSIHNCFFLKKYYSIHKLAKWKDVENKPVFFLKKIYNIHKLARGKAMHLMQRRRYAPSLFRHVSLCVQEEETMQHILWSQGLV